MFRDAAAFNQDISGSNTGGVTELTTMSDMLTNGATRFNQAINTWTVTAVTSRDNFCAAGAGFTSPSTQLPPFAGGYPTPTCAAAGTLGC